MMSGSAVPSTVLHTGCHTSAGRTSDTAASGTNTSSSTTVSRAGAPQADGVPGPLDRDAVGGERHRAVDDLRAVGCVVPADRGDQQVARRGRRSPVPCGPRPGSRRRPPGPSRWSRSSRRRRSRPAAGPPPRSGGGWPRPAGRGGGARPGCRSGGSASTASPPSRRTPGRAGAARRRPRRGWRRRRPSSRGTGARRGSRSCAGARCSRPRTRRCGRAGRPTARSAAATSSARSTQSVRPLSWSSPR